LTLADDPRVAPEPIVALHEECGEELRRLALGVLRDPHLAADAVQSAFVKAIEQGHTAKESLRGWLFRVVLNEALALKRRQGVDQRALNKLNWLAECGHDARDCASSNNRGRPDEQACQREDNERVRAALETLPDEQRQIVWMRLYEQKTFAVIAKELHVPLGTVLWRMQAAVKKLRQRLQVAEDPGPDDVGPDDLRGENE
jgi:RNA polymerase sigma factor (sigma-70 family)